ncbi:MAG TPA: hydroxyisourate hydrolase [Acidimicrobiia bacterium]|jgi:5-hydroxyisourate hydrolase
MTGADGTCRLTLHVLDVSAGRPAAGMAVALVLHAPGDATDTPVPTELVTTDLITDVDGRAGGDGVPLLAPGTHELRYAVGGYFGSTPTFYDVVPVRFVVRADDTHVHVAVLVSPWSYTTYRGS